MNDDELRRRFSKLREEDARRAPPFADLVRRGRPRARRPPWAIVVPLASAASAAAVFLLWCGAQSTLDGAPAAAPPPAAAPASVAIALPPSAEREPLGFLLALPGSAALKTTASDLDPSFLQEGSR